MDFQNIEKINFPIAANISVGLAGLVIPGFLLLYIYDPELFERLDFMKLLFLSVAACLPTFLVPYGFTALAQRALVHRLPEALVLWGTPRDWYIRHAFSNALNMYTGILIVWAFDFGSAGIVLLILGGVILNSLIELFHFAYFIKSPTSLYSVWLQPSSDTNSRIDQ